MSSAKWTSSQRLTTLPSTASMRSPGLSPAVSAGEPSATTPTTGGTSRSAATSMPIMKTTAISTTDSTAFIAGPAR